jgi:type 1 fimbriae regulatory protein FimB
VGVIKYASKAQVEKFLARAKQVSARDYAIFLIMYWHGLRVSEVGKLQLTDWKPESGRLYIRRSKNGISAEYPVNNETRRAITAWLKARGDKPGPLFVSRRGRGIGVRQLADLFSKYAARADWPEDLQHPHVMRHSIAVHMVEQGLDILAVKDWLGHRNISSTVIYAQLTNAARERVAEQVFAKPDDGKVRVNWKQERKRK